MRHVSSWYIQLFTTLRFKCGMTLQTSYFSPRFHRLDEICSFKHSECFPYNREFLRCNFLVWKKVICWKTFYFFATHFPFSLYFRLWADLDSGIFGTKIIFLLNAVQKEKCAYAPTATRPSTKVMHDKRRTRFKQIIYLDLELWLW